jgi:uncharacterized protein YndB with AHSA1/START domain/uncharacterized protein YciI
MKRIAGVVLAVMALFFAHTRVSRSEVREAHTAAFVVEQDVVIAASPETVFDAATGDITGWWDHHMSEKPKKIYIEPKPGGGFYEIFDDAGNGVLHATVNYADRGKKLIFTGPLGFAGHALTIVTTYEFKPDPSGTRLHLTSSNAGEFPEGVDKSVLDGVWHHFLVERLKPYVESGAYLKKKSASAASPPASPDATPKMKQYFVAFLFAGPNRNQSATEVEKLQNEHLAYIRMNVERRNYALAGPFDDDGRIRGMIIVAANSAEAANGIVAQDPAVLAGRLAIEIHPAWLPTALDGFLLRQ